MSTSPSHEEALLALARQKPLAERDAFLTAVCGSDQQLRARLERKLTEPALEPKASSTELSTPGPSSRATIKLEFDEQAADEAVGQSLGRYKLLERVGEGGCGVVYVAEQTEPVRRRVALKVIKLGMDTKAVVARFEAERQALAMMDHPNIAKVLDAGATDLGRPFFVMELVRGIRITDYCDQNKLSTQERLDLFIKVCHAIQHAHQKGIIHRDIKPSNMLVTLHDGVPVPKVIDFGIAKATEGRLTDATVYTQLNQFIGTPAYMSPEQAEMSGLDIDTRSDIYSLGVLLYELLTGKTPFDAGDLMSKGIDAMRKTIREVEPIRPSTRLATLQGEERTTTAKRHALEMPRLIHQLKGDLDWVVMKCLEKDRTRRYETANGLAADLKRHLSNEPVSARPPSAAYRFQKSFRRNKLVFLASGAVAASLVAGIAVSSWQAIEARRSQRLADQARFGEQNQRIQAESERERANLQARRAAESEQKARRWLYAADMNLVQQAIKASNLGRARELLYRNVPREGEEDLRGWEWRYFWQLCRSDELSTFYRHSQSIYKLNFSPDGRRLVFTTPRGDVQVLDTSDGRKLADLAHSLNRTMVATFSPGGEVVAVTRPLNELILYDTTTWNPVVTLTNAGVARTLHYSPDGTRLLAVNRNNSIQVWETKPPYRMHSRPSPPTSIHHGEAVFTRDNQRIVFGDSRGRIAVLNAETLEELHSFQHPAEGVSAVAVSPDGRHFATGSGYSSPLIHLWEVDTGKLVRTLEGHRSHVPMLAYSPDGRWLASASADQTMRLWDATNGQNVATFQGHGLEVWSVTFSRDGSRIFTGSKDGEIKIWDPLSRPRGNAFQVHSNFAREANRAALSRDGKVMVYLNRLGQLMRLPLESGKPEAPQAGPWTTPALALASDLGSQLAIYDYESATTYLGGMEESTSWKRFKPESERWAPLYLEEKTQRLVAIRDQTNSVSVFDAASGRSLHRWSYPAMPGLRTSARAGHLVALLYQSQQVQIIDLLTGQISNEFFLGGGKGAGAGAFAAGSTLAMSPDGKLLAVGTEYGTTSLFATTDGRLLEILKGHLRGVHGVEFLPDGRRLLTSSGDDEAAKIWDVTTRQELCTLPGTGSIFRPAGVSADQSTITAVNSRGELHVWRAPSWQEIAAAESRKK